MSATPPPPPALPPSVTAHLLPIWAAVQCAAGIGALLWPLLQPTRLAPVYSLVGAFLVLHAALLLLSAFGELPLARKALRGMGTHVVNSGVGFYGLVTLSRFLHLEALDLIEGLQSGLPDTVRELVKDWVIGFSVDSLMNTIEAFQWPWKLLLPAGWPVAAVAVLACYVPYTMANRVMPDLAAVISAEEDEDEDSGKEAADKS